MLNISHIFHKHYKPSSHPDVVLIGAGIMSATLGVFLKELQPSLKIEIHERLGVIAGESSDAWNNAGTGHSAFCELNYTPELENGEIDASKAFKIAEMFEISKQFWAYLIEQDYINNPKSFINSVPHMSFVWGENVDFLKKRYAVLKEHPLFNNIEFSDDYNQLSEWVPLIMKGRDKSQKLAATKIKLGTDMNFGELTRLLFQHLKSLPDVSIYLNSEVDFIEKNNTNNHWQVEVNDLNTKQKRTIETKFLFIGAGGGALPLLEKTEIPEASGFGGFPVGGQWLVCKNENVIEQHAAKVYGKAEVGSPPMSVPHLDTRIINGKKALLFGPFAGFSTKFLKHGSLMDLPHSLQVNNILPIISVGLHNIPLTRYLINQVKQSPEDRLNALKKFVPTAKIEDWVLEEAGQRVQVIKKDQHNAAKGVLEFGTEIVSSADGTIAALLGASPGASTSVSIMLNLLEKCFPEQLKSPEWQNKLKEMIPTYGKIMAKDERLCKTVRESTCKSLELMPN
ncbi:MAG: malate dehydrogenase (quinone) [Bacteroidetes bacterium]|nr:malate dehydrogenase (quinone) [Bacteroidota bacterium]